MKLILQENPDQSQFLLYQTEDGKTQLEVRFDQETVWLSQNQMAELFQTSKPPEDYETCGRLCCQ